MATTGQGIRVVDAQNGATTEEGAFALSRPLQAGAFNYTLNRDSDEDWYLRSENAYRAEVPLYTSMLTQAMDYDRILAGSRSHQTGVNGENNSVRLSIQGGHLGHPENEYDWLSSDAAVDEVLLINEYTFTEAGLRAG